MGFAGAALDANRRYRNELERAQVGSQIDWEGEPHRVVQQQKKKGCVVLENTKTKKHMTVVLDDIYQPSGGFF